jgi:hypothetical protein
MKTQESRSGTEEQPAVAAGSVASVLAGGTVGTRTTGEAEPAPAEEPAGTHAAGTHAAGAPIGAAQKAPAEAEPASAAPETAGTERVSQTPQEAPAEHATEAAPESGETGAAPEGAATGESGDTGESQAEGQGGGDPIAEAAAAARAKTGEKATKPENTRRISKPVAAGAALLGALLLASPFAISALTSNGPSHSGKPPTAAFEGQNGAAGFVPGAQSAAPVAPGKTGAGTAPSGTGGKSGTAHHGSGSAANPSGHGATSGNHATAPAPAPGGSNSGSHPSDAAAAATYTAVGGPYCSNSSTGFHEYGKWTDGQKGWTTHVGQYTSSGCDGHYVSVPMSGDSGTDKGNSAVWTFSTGSVHSGTCQVSVYVPNDSNVEHVGGHPTTYSVYDAIGASGSSVGSFQVAQTSNRGHWVAGGSYRVTDGRLSVELHDRGIDYTSGYQEAHHAAAAISLSCKS